jgi:hypothetical protein
MKRINNGAMKSYHEGIASRTVRKLQRHGPAVRNNGSKPVNDFFTSLLASILDPIVDTRSRKYISM